jgi:predicted small secreted protein
MKKLTSLALILALGSSTLLTSCETGTGTGALVGAGIGSIIGANTNSGGNGRIAAGAGLGALAGALVGAIYDEDKRATRERYNEDRYTDSYDGRERNYPYGEPTRYVGYVRSPYRPYNTIDVRGIPSGALVLDPSVDRAFRNP